MSDCRFGVSPVNYPDPDPERKHYAYRVHFRKGVFLQNAVWQYDMNKIVALYTETVIYSFKSLTS